MLKFYESKEYLCICNDCKFSFQSEQFPIPKFIFFSSLKKKIKSSQNETRKHCVQTSTKIKAKSTVKCPSRGNFNVSLIAVID